MSNLFENYHKMPDGTIKMVNPFTGTEVWTVPGRGKKPITNEIPRTANKLSHDGEEEACCEFCQKRYLDTPPEKARVVVQDGEYKVLHHVNADNLFDTVAEFRLIPNLFEIITYDYWAQNYQYAMCEENRKHKDRYLNSAKGIEHVVNIVNLKLILLGKSEKQIEAMTLDEKLKIADSFFGGGHELIIAKRHYVEGATYDVELNSSGELTPDEHYQYFRFTIDSMKRMYSENRYVRFIAIFQNWLSAAGATFDHLHKQLVAIDEWGTSLERELDLVRKNKNIYNEKAANFASYHNLVIAENDYAIAFAEIGHRYPTLAIYSKSEHGAPQDHSPEEVRGISDIVHACHAAMGSQIPCNEEWYSTPIDATENIPWHILIKWRTNNPAGFEGGTKIYVNPISPEHLRDIIVPRLFELKNKGKIAKFPIAFECSCKPNSLKYVKGKRRI